MNYIDGTVSSYTAMKVSLTNIMQKSPKVWSADRLNVLKENLRHTSEDALGLTHGSASHDSELFNGMALEYQWIRSRESMDMHSHAWWHLFFVISGQVFLLLEKEVEKLLGPGDTAFIPPGAAHGFRNEDPDSDVVMYSLTNKAELAQIGQFITPKTVTVE
ncbi:cupin domain-containing protein [Allorhizobium terrae]|uniref:Cupin domain-containing protein n=1 Tax=Allorhizobium terrae TaxID=1848972 RepID=A0A4S3ZUA8_9HYPH|nr:cupin domain-containing protein [Allorhizobium terrae]THF49224.1 cupin domain-containing protein [Allorhizobium terrae]TWD44817.1 cupin domain [Agrobacterium vitis]